MKKAIALDKQDNVATLMASAGPDEVVQVVTGNETRELKLAQPIQFGHKLALTSIEPGEDIIKYGQVIGRATQKIATGHHVHVHNVESLRGRGDLG